jgi:hypothetical protein
MQFTKFVVLKVIIWALQQKELGELLSEVFHQKGHGVGILVRAEPSECDNFLIKVIIDGFIRWFHIWHIDYFTE